MIRAYATLNRCEEYLVPDAVVAGCSERWQKRNAIERHIFDRDLEPETADEYEWAVVDFEEGAE
jgi:hypothetical protein